VVLDYGIPPAAATSKMVIRSIAFPVLLVVSALLRVWSASIPFGRQFYVT
jgi:hypothetical protein